MRWRNGIESGSKGWLGCGLAAIVALASAGPLTAGTLYVTDYGTTTIHRVETDGTGLTTLMSGSPNLRGAAVDAVHGKLYWLEAGPNKLRRANLDGSLVEDVVTGMPGSPYELALDATGGKVYWTEYVGALAIRRANLDGTAVEDLVTSGHSQPLGIALDLSAGKMYWADYDLGTIHRADLGGSSVELVLSGLSAPRNLVIDEASGQFYFTWGLGSGGVSRANLDGTDLTLIVAEAGNPTGLVLDDEEGRLYWARDDSGSVRSATTSGADVTTVVTGLTRALGLAFKPDPTTMLYVSDYGTTTLNRVGTDGSGQAALLSGLPNLRGVEVDATHGKLYWAEAGPYRLRRSNLDGSGIEDVVTGLPGAPYELALDPAGEKIYWTEYYGALGIRRANLDGTDVEDLVLSGLAQPLGIELDLPAGKMYWADYDLGSIYRADLDGSAVELLLSGLSQPRNLAIDRASGQFFFTWGLGWGGVSRANLDGTGLTGLVAEPCNAAGLALDTETDRLYWACDDSGTVHSATTSGTELSLVASGFTRALGLAISGVASAPVPAEEVRLIDSSGSGLAGGVVSYYFGGWQPYGVTGADGRVALDLPDGTYTFRIEYAGASLQKAQNVATDPLVVFATRDVTVRLEDSAGNPLDPGVADYYAAGWKAFGSTVSGEVHRELLPTTYTFAMSYAGARVQKAQNVATDPLVVFATRDVTVRLEDSAGNPLDPGVADYYAAGWKAFGSTASGEVHRELLPTTYTFAMSYAGARVQKAQNVATDPLVVFATRDVTVRLEDSAGNPLDPGVADYYAAGWKAFGSTASGEVHRELLPTTYTFAMSYAGARVQKAQNVATDPLVIFATRDVTVRLEDSAGNPLDPGVADYYAAGWKAFGSTAGGEVHRELLPTTYTFAMSYAGARVQKAQNVATDPLVVFQTGSVVSGSGTCSSYYAAGWRTFTAGMQLLPMTYTFGFSSGTPTQQSFAIQAGTENLIR